VAVNTRSSPSLLVPTLPAALLAILSVAGCVVGPDYKRPDLTTAREFRSQLGPTEAISIADLPWWKVFNDKTLHRLITQALQENYDLQVAVTRIEQARALVGVARADLYPQLGYEGVAARQETFVPFEFRNRNITYNTFGVAANAAWELDLWGRIRRTTEAAQANLFAQQDIRRGVMLTLVSDAAAGYFVLLELDRELAIAQESADTFKRTLDLFTLRFQAGRDSKLAVVRAQANYDFSLASIAALNRAIVQQENALCVLLGIYPREIERGIKLTEQVTPETPPGLTTDIIKRRPDIQQAEQVMVGANAEIGVAVANYFPRVGLSALFGGQAPHIENIADSKFNVWHVGAGVSGPIFQGGRLQSTYEAQRAFWDETIAQYKKTVLTAFRETSDALIAQQTLVGQRTALQDQVKALRESVSLSLARYDSGRATYFEVLEAEQSLFPSEDALAQTQRDQLIAVVNLYKALGGGWNLKDADWAHPPD
jgi:outer membrane protein, multidrug efflux system